ncbi:MAG: NAD(P)H-hydrate dehydratase [Chloroflexi bacterium]|nr:NAD(P)H-hydrate dehydratase [Chloroflexota bacterium]
MKLCTSEQMRELEQAAVAAGTSLDELMEQAGLAVAQEVWLNLGIVAGRRVLVLVGPGNNGGDGLVAARHLADWDADVCVYMTRLREGDKNLDLARERGVTVFNAENDAGYEKLQEAMDGAEVVVDALLGIGPSRPIEGTMAEILRRLGERTGEPRPPKVIAVDLPTGVDADSGRADALAVTAELTVTFGVAKVGLYMLAGSEHVGRVEVVDIGLPKEAELGLPVELLTTACVRERLPKRPKSANKGTFGKVFVLAGSQDYVGAARLCAEACYRVGAGLVTVACPKAVQSAIASALPEATFFPYGLLGDDTGHLTPSWTNGVIGVGMHDADVLLMGPGLTQHPEVAESLEAVVELGTRPDMAAVIDADALNALATWSDCWQYLKSPSVLTPHPGEMARLLGTTVEAVQADRLGRATSAAKTWGQVVVLKGAHTIVAAPDGRVAISPHANPLLATAGTGDVLAGTIAGLLAQGMAPFEAGACGVFVHGLAAEELSEELGDRGLLASELLPAIPRAMRTILHGKKPAPGGAASLFGGLGDFSGLAGLGASPAAGPPE